MAKDMITMRRKELTRLQIIGQVIKKQIKQVNAAEALGMSERQIRRILVRVKQEGESGVIHRLRGRASQRRIVAETREKAMELCRGIYAGFGPVFASEKLKERDGISVSDETLRKWMHEEGIITKARRRRKHRQWRERKQRSGELVQMDGSHHAWLEERGPWLVLMGYIDDATGRKYGRFYEYEGTMPALDSLKRYVRKYGIPQAIYLDRHSRYKSHAKETIADQLENRKAKSHFEKAAERVGIQVIHANSAPAKGRVERSFRTDQDRLVKELRLRNISTMQEANKYLEVYWGNHNQRFSIEPAQGEDLHRRIEPGMDLESALSVQTEHRVRNDGTVTHQGQWYQILARNVGQKVAVEERPGGIIRILSKGRAVVYKILQPQPKQKERTVKPLKAVSGIRGRVNPTNHPWKKPSFDLRMATGGKLRLAG